MSVFGSYLQKKMDERGWDGLTLQKLSGVSDANISRYRKGGRPSPVNVASLAKAFGEEPAEWMRLAGYPVGDPADPSEDEKELLTQVRSFPWLQALVPDIAALSPQNQRVVQDLVKSLRRQEGDDSQ